MRAALLILGVVGLSTAVLYHHLAVAEAKAYGYAMGTREALSVTPPSEQLEVVCAGLWLADNDRKWQKRGLR
jgi:hypothetical protein